LGIPTRNLRTGAQYRQLAPFAAALLMKTSSNPRWLQAGQALGTVVA